MPIENTGQAAGSPPAGENVDGNVDVNVDANLDPTQMAAAAAAEAAKGQEAGTPTGKEGVKGEGAAGKDVGKDFIEKDGVKYYAAFDKHPEWRELKDAKDEFQSVLDDSQFKNKAELIAALESGQSLKDLLGDQDAAALQEAANNWYKAEEYWAEQEAAKTEEGETQDQTIERLKTEKAELVKQQKTETARTQEQKSSREAIKGFNSEVAGTIDEAKLAESEVSLAKLVLGLDNPMDDVDIQDKKAVRLALTENVGKFKGLVKDIRQAAVDDYVAGKKEIVPIGKAEGGDAPVQGEKFTVGKDETTEEAIARANTQLVEMLNAVGNE